MKAAAQQKILDGIAPLVTEKVKLLTKTKTTTYRRYADKPSVPVHEATTGELFTPKYVQSVKFESMWFKKDETVADLIARQDNLALLFDIVTAVATEGSDSARASHARADIHNLVRWGIIPQNLVIVRVANPSDWTRAFYNGYDYAIGGGVKTTSAQERLSKLGPTLETEVCGEITKKVTVGTGKDAVRYTQYSIAPFLRFMFPDEVAFMSNTFIDAIFEQPERETVYDLGTPGDGREMLAQLVAGNVRTTFYSPERIDGKTRRVIGKDKINFYLGATNLENLFTTLLDDRQWYGPLTGINGIMGLWSGADMKDPDNCYKFFARIYDLSRAYPRGIQNDEIWARRKTVLIHIDRIFGPFEDRATYLGWVPEGSKSVKNRRGRKQKRSYFDRYRLEDRIVAPRDDYVRVDWARLYAPATEIEAKHEAALKVKIAACHIKNGDYLDVSTMKAEYKRVYRPGDWQMRKSDQPVPAGYVPCTWLAVFIRKDKEKANRRYWDKFPGGPQRKQKKGAVDGVRDANEEDDDVEGEDDEDDEGVVAADEQPTGIGAPTFPKRPAERSEPDEDEDEDPDDGWYEDASAAADSGADASGAADSASAASASVRPVAAASAASDAHRQAISDIFGRPLTDDEFEKYQGGGDIWETTGDDSFLFGGGDDIWETTGDDRSLSGVDPVNRVKANEAFYARFPGAPRSPGWIDSTTTPTSNRQVWAQPSSSSNPHLTTTPVPLVPTSFTPSLTPSLRAGVKRAPQIAAPKAAASAAKEAPREPDSDRRQDPMSPGDEHSSSDDEDDGRSFNEVAAAIGELPDVVAFIRYEGEEDLGSVDEEEAPVEALRISHEAFNLKEWDAFPPDWDAGIRKDYGVYEAYGDPQAMGGEVAVNLASSQDSVDGHDEEEDEDAPSTESPPARGGKVAQKLAYLQSFGGKVAQKLAFSQGSVDVDLGDEEEDVEVELVDAVARDAPESTRDDEGRGSFARNSLEHETIDAAPVDYTTGTINGLTGIDLALEFDIAYFNWRLGGLTGGDEKRQKMGPGGVGWMEGEDA